MAILSSLAHGVPTGLSWESFLITHLHRISVSTFPPGDPHLQCLPNSHVCGEMEGQEHTQLESQTVALFQRKPHKRSPLGIWPRPPWSILPPTRSVWVHWRGQPAGGGEDPRSPQGHRAGEKGHSPAFSGTGGPGGPLPQTLQASDETAQRTLSKKSVDSSISMQLNTVFN